MTEEQLQAKCFQWHWAEFPSERRMLFAINNNSKDRREGNQHKAIGVVAGVSDLILVARLRTVYIEMKTERGVQEKEQIEFEDKVFERGHAYHLCRSFEQFKAIIWQVYGK